MDAICVPVPKEKRVRDPLVLMQAVVSYPTWASVIKL